MNDTQPSVRGRQTSVTATILVIDEQLLVSSALAYTLRDLGFDAHFIRVSDLKTMRTAAAAHLPGLVLLDLDLGSCPDDHRIDAIDLVDPLHAQGWTVLVMTSTASPERIADAIAHGAASWIAKGATFNELVHAAVEIMQSRDHQP
jgi:DNA-binding NtrC family response regulator